ncbi:hypothetical protein FRB94_008436 [Tulasnella sp. JGI-2019a]|nr:hypothetical protein FRB94_008436 [Tulasnella sp. JGI-2019a]KAG8999145.1 hypothetical protein FRB93_013302 [Tulasnella sp. JGI-2019a]KAG9030679.1 hypothetical protein FRB95_003640 [Tulasnella sp. JGI-2019a]
MNGADCHLFRHLRHTTHPDLCHVHLGQSVRVSPFHALFPVISLPNLERLVLVDVYPGSIWQQRLWMVDLKAAWDEMPEDGLDEAMGSGDRKPDWEMVRQKIELNMGRSGGDRSCDH